MAKKETDKNSRVKDLQKKETERKAKEKVEQKERLKQRQLKEKKKKLKEKKIKKAEEKEKKRIKSIIDFPFKLLLQSCLLITVLAFIIQYFGAEIELSKAIFYSFLLFTLLYLGIGLVIVAIFFVLSDNKKQELIEQKRIEEELKIAEEKRIAEEEVLAEERRQEEERTRLEELEKFKKSQTENTNNSIPIPDEPEFQTFSTDDLKNEDEWLNNQLKNTPDLPTLESNQAEFMKFPDLVANDDNKVIKQINDIKK